MMDSDSGASRKRQRVASPLAANEPVHLPRGCENRNMRTSSSPSRNLGIIDAAHQKTTARSAQPHVSQFVPPMTTQINWRETLCQFLDVSPGVDDAALVETLQSTAERTRIAESPQLSSPRPSSPSRDPGYEVIYRISCFASGAPLTGLYLEGPWLVNSGPHGAHLRASTEIGHFELYLERHKELQFVVYKDYSCCGSKPAKEEEPNGDSGNTETYSTSESVCIITEEFSEALNQLSQSTRGKLNCPDFEVVEQFYSPYLWWYQAREVIEETLLMMNPQHQTHIQSLGEYIQEALGNTYAQVDALLKEGRIMAENLSYLYSPGQILVSITDGENAQDCCGFNLQSWLQSPTNISRNQSAQHERLLEVMSWGFDGNYQKNQVVLTIGKLPSLSEPFSIRSLNVYPVGFASEETVQLLRARGEMFWACRKRKYVCCNKDIDMPINATTDPRFMIDIDTYKQFHPPDGSKPPNRDDLGPSIMSQESPPLGDEFLLCLPTRIPGYHMQKKQWISLPVSRILPVQWNTKAFDTLVVSDQTKELITALVTNQIAVERGTDLMSGKGNGLFILLHGGPGTGKTLTAESVAEIAKKPLYRVTCGDIGTNADEVEKYLETVLLLGKIWGCVVLLDEADIFLEERTLNDYKRNALVSVFLRVLEYYDGILILTSNRVATFDEAFKSRIQLSLRYKALGPEERFKIWGNFIDHISSLPEPTSSTQNLADTDRARFDYGINAAQIKRRLREFAGAVLNGREIRNVVTTARQLAIHRKQPLDCDHIAFVMEEAKKFDDYLKEVQGGLNSDELKREEQVR